MDIRDLYQEWKACEEEDNPVSGTTLPYLCFSCSEDHTLDPNPLSCDGLIWETTHSFYRFCSSELSGNNVTDNHTA